jgi:hypothetical protein
MGIITVHGLTSAVDFLEIIDNLLGQFENPLRIAFRRLTPTPL